MTDRPILFSAPMVRAMRDLRKTCTRRILNPQPIGEPWFWEGDEVDPRPQWFDGYEAGRMPCGAAEREVNTPIRMRYAVGDRLWVRENFSGPYAMHILSPSCWNAEWPTIREDGGIWYWADGNPDDGDWTRPKPSIHMPRWASRTTLVVKAVKVERLQDISEADAIAEGILRSPHGNQDLWCDYPLGSSAAGWTDPRHSFESLWESIHGAEAWEANPWVAAIDFTVLRCNIDALPK